MIRDFIAEIDENILIADGFDDALIGYVESYGQPKTALYDTEKCILILMKKLKLSKEKAEEYFRYNTLGAFVGEYTPFFATILK